MAWQSPTGHDDPDNKWSSETAAYDDDTGTDANCGDLGYYLELTIGAISCNKIQIWASEEGYNPDVAIDVYYSAAWHNIFSGTITEGEWVEKAIGSTQSVTAARVKANSLEEGRLELYEFDFNEVAALQISVHDCADLKEKVGG